MKRKKRYLKRNKAKTGEFIKSNQKTVFLILIFIIGVFFGAYSVKSSDSNIFISIKELAENYIKLKSNNSVLMNFVNSITTDSLFLIISVVFGLCLIGSPILWALPAIRGIGIGVILGYIYINYAVKGIFYSLVAICIPSAISVCALIISCKEGLLTLSDINETLENQKGFSKKQFYKMYFLRNIILFAVMMFSAAVGSIMTLIPSVNLSF